MKILLILAVSVTCSANPALIAHTAAGSPGGGTTVTTSAINSTGANLLIAVASNYLADSCLGGNLTDSKSNTWIPLTNFQQTTVVNLCVWYVLTPVVGSGHTVTIVNSFPAVAFSAWSGVLSFSTETHASPITPTQAGDLIISCYGDVNGTSTISVDSGFTKFDEVVTGGINSANVGVAYLIAPNTGAVDPQWTTNAAVYTSSDQLFIRATSSAAQTSSPIIY